MPVILGSESSECGLAAIAMVAAHHGLEIGLNSLRERFSLSLSGVTLKTLTTIAEELDFSSRAIRVELNDLRAIPLPAILHWDFRHFVVLASINSRHAVIHDPARGRRKIELAELSNHFTGIALEVVPTSTFEPKVEKPTVSFGTFWSNIYGFWNSFGQILSLSIALQVVVFAAPFFLQLVVDQVLARDDVELLTALAIAFGSLVIVQVLMEALRSYSVQALGHMLSFQLVGNLVHHLIRLKAEYFERRHIGDIISRIQSTTPIKDLISQGVIAVILDGALSIIALVIMFFYSISLTVVVLISIAILALINVISYPIIERRLEEKIVTTANEQSHLMQSIRAHETIKMMGLESERVGSWRNLLADSINASFGLGKVHIVKNGLQAAVTGLQTIIVIYLAAQAIISGSGFSIGMLFAYLSFRTTFSSRVLGLINQLLQFSLLRLHFDRISDIVGAERDPPPSIEVAGSRNSNVSVELRNVSFRYGLSDPVILSSISLHIPPGSFIAIRGPSGSGKTTLIKLLLGLYSPTSGEVLLNGETANLGDLRRWRRNVGIVSQNDRLLTGTLAENIGFFDSALDMKAVERAAKSAQVHDEIERMPMRYHTLVGDMGSTLSGGQRQRILLARALYRNPSVLVLDEGTANLDINSEEAIVDLIERLPITRIVVAHRPALIQRASVVFHLENGSIHQVKASE